jgi:hypothetical protein
MTMATSPEDAIQGYLARIAADPELQELIGTGPGGFLKAEEGFLSQKLAPHAYPYHTFYSADEREIRAGSTYIVYLQTDTFVWPEGSRGGAERRKAIDDRILALVSEQSWRHNDAILYAVTGSARNIPSGVDSPLRKTRRFEIYVSPAE